MRWSKLFVGRKKELSQLIAAYDKAFRGSVQIVPIVAETGFGKTRLAQEFYNWLSVNRDPAGEAGYWPDLLERIEDNLTVNPPAENCGQRKLVMPYLWWGLRIPDPGSRNEIISGALWPAIGSLKPHLAQHQKEVEKRAIKFKAMKEGAKGATSLGFDVLGNIVTFGLLGAGKTIVESGIAFYNIHKERVALEEKTVTPNQTHHNINEELNETIISDLRLLACPPSTNLPQIPLVLLLDDAQWLSQDQSTLAFFEQLIATSKQEHWPLLLIITCWEKEWHNSEKNRQAPAKWLDLAKDDSPILLGSAKGMESIISEAFPGLLPLQVDLLLDKADGNPRFLDEILMFLERSPKYFQERDQCLPLSKKGEEALADMNFAKLVLDRFEAAPENVRKVLALSGLQGMSFSPHITQLMAESASIKQAGQAISYSETPLGFTSIRNETTNNLSESKAKMNKKESLSAEFRLKAYREAALEDLENHIDEKSALQYFAKARQQINSTLSQSLNIDLEILMAFVEEPQTALAAAAELIKRANEKLDNLIAAKIATNVMPLLKEVDTPPPYDVADKILEADSNFNSVTSKHLEIVDRFILLFSSQQTKGQNLTLQQQIDVTKYYRFRSRINYILSGGLKAAEDAQISLIESRAIADKYQSADTKANLAIATNDVARVTQVTEGPEAAKPLFLEVKQLMRALAEELETPSARKDLALATFDLATVTRDIDGPEAAKPLFVEVYRLMRILAEELQTPSARKDLASATYHLAAVTQEIDGPEAAKPFFIESERLMRALAEELKTISARLDLAIATSHLAIVSKDVGGSEAAKPLFVKYEQMMRVLAAELKSPIVNKNLAIAIYHLAKVMYDIDGPEAAKPLFVEVVQLSKTLAEELKTPSARKDLANAIFQLAIITYHLEGPDTAQPLFLENERLMLALADELKTPNARMDLINATSHLANVTREIGGSEVAKPLFVKYEQLMRALASELKTPSARKELANAAYHLATVIRDIDGPGAAKPLFVENEQLMRALAEELKTPSSRKDLALAIYHLATVTRDTDGPEAAQPHLFEVEGLMRTLAEELKTPSARTDLANAIYHLATVTRETDGPGAAKPLFMEYEQLMRVLAGELKTPSARRDLALAIYQLATITRDTDGPGPSKPFFADYVQLMRTLFGELKTPSARMDLANATSHLAIITRDTNGPGAAKSLFVEYEQLSRTLAEELKTPSARTALANAIYHLATVTRETDGPGAAKPLFMEYEQLMRVLAGELKTPSARRDLALAIYQLATVTRDSDGPGAAKPIFALYEQLMRKLFGELKTPSARMDLANATSHLAIITRDTDGPRAAKSLFVEYEQLSRTLAEEIKIPSARRDLALAIYQLATITRETDGPAAAKPLFAEHKQLMRTLALELKTPSARRDLANATSQLATVTRDSDGPRAAKPIFALYEQLMRTLAEELKTPSARRDLALATFHLAIVTQEINGPETAKPLFEENEQRMRTLAGELNTPNARMDLAIATHYLATVTHEVQGGEESKSLFKESLELAKTAASQLKTPNSQYHSNLIELLTYQNRRGPVQHNHALFDSVVLNPPIAEDEIDSLLKIEKNIDEYAESKILDRSEVVNVARIKNIIVAFYIVTEKIDCAKNKLDQINEYFESLSQLNSHNAKEQLVLFSFYKAQVAISTHDFTAADDNFQAAYKLVNQMHPDFWNVPYFRSLICWYYSHFLHKSGKKETAIQLIELGVTAAQQFTKYNVRNGQEILAAFIDTQSKLFAKSEENSV